MTAPTYGKPVIQPEDIVERIDALIPRTDDGTPLAWTRGYVRGQLLLDARNEIERLRARVEVLERVREAALTYLKAKTVEGARYAIDVLQEAKP
jgi:hypothetical protein